eukprot:GHRR01025433.1.p2 GENE.GHRR01025433.1~~GHRR01025433.1.p2  ORF type:complete len:106 (-),score=9.98 GHRR01025433.1:492-809(-)
MSTWSLIQMVIGMGIEQNRHSCKCTQHDESPWKCMSVGSAGPNGPNPAARQIREYSANVPPSPLSSKRRTMPTYLTSTMRVSVQKNRLAALSTCCSVGGAVNTAW